MAASLGQVEILCFLLSKGANPLVKDCRGDTPLVWGARNGHVDVMMTLVNSGAHINNRNNVSNQHCRSPAGFLVFRSFKEPYSSR